MVPLTATSPYLVDSSPGGVVSAGSTLSLGNAVSVSPDSDWQIEDYPRTITPPSFDTLRKRVRLSYLYTDQQFTLDGSGGPGVKRIDSLNELTTGAWFTLDSDFTIDDPLRISGDKNLIIFVGKEDVPKDININKNIKITDDSTLILVSSNDIWIDPNVTELHGVYYTAGSGSFGISAIYTGYKEPQGTDSQLTVHGSLLGGPNSRVLLERNLGDIANKTTPSELVICQAKYFLSPSASLFRSPVKGWQEVAP